VSELPHLAINVHLSKNVIEDTLNMSMEAESILSVVNNYNSLLNTSDLVTGGEVFYVHEGEFITKDSYGAVLDTTKAYKFSNGSFIPWNTNNLTARLEQHNGMSKRVLLLKDTAACIVETIPTDYNCEVAGIDGIYKDICNDTILQRPYIGKKITALLADPIEANSPFSFVAYNNYKYLHELDLGPQFTDTLFNTTK
jgi:hypothetical protein